MEEKGVILPSVLRQAFEKLYGYTNDKSTGIRHPLMDDTNAPQAEEALFMLVSCNAFINYLNKKVKQESLNAPCVAKQSWSVSIEAASSK